MANNSTPARIVTEGSTDWARSRPVTTFAQLAFNGGQIGETACGRTIYTGHSSSGARLIAVSGNCPDERGWAYCGLV